MHRPVFKTAVIKSTAMPMAQWHRAGRHPVQYPAPSIEGLPVIAAF